MDLHSIEEQAGYIGLIRGTLQAQKAYLTSLETSDMFAPPVSGSAETNGMEIKKTKKDKKTSHPAHNTQAKALRGSLDALLGLHGKLHGDMPFAKREIAWGKLDAKDLDEIFRLFRSILIPLIGMGTITDIFERIAERRGWVRVPNSKYHESEKWEECGDDAKEREKASWNAIMKTLHEPFEVVSVCPPSVSISTLNLQIHSRANYLSVHSSNGRRLGTCKLTSGIDSKTQSKAGQ